MSDTISKYVNAGTTDDTYDSTVIKSSGDNKIVGGTLFLGRSVLYGLAGQQYFQVKSFTCDVTIGALNTYVNLTFPILVPPVTPVLVDVTPPGDFTLTAGNDYSFTNSSGVDIPLNFQVLWRITDVRNNSIYRAGLSSGINIPPAPPLPAVPANPCPDTPFTIGYSLNNAVAVDLAPIGVIPEIQVQTLKDAKNQSINTIVDRSAPLMSVKPATPAPWVNAETIKPQFKLNAGGPAFVANYNSNFKVTIEMVMAGRIAPP